MITEGNDMRISLIHGEDSQKAYNKYRELIDGAKKKGFEIVSINDLKDIVTQSLFEDKIVFTLNRSNKIKLTDWKWLSKNSLKYNSNLLIYYEGNAPVTITKSLPKDAKIEKFELPRIIFSFLDSFWIGNSKNCLRLLNDLIKNEPIELVFHLLCRHLRDLFWVKVSKETMTVPDWRDGKLLSQANKFSDIGLKKIINELAEIDVQTKTSNENLKDMLDILIVKNL